MRGIRQIFAAPALAAATLAAFGPAQVLAQRETAPPIRANTPCEFGAAMVAELRNGSETVIFADRVSTPVKLAPRPEDDPIVRGLIEDWNRQPPTSLLRACPRIAAHLPPNVRLATAEEMAATGGIRRVPMQKSVSLPVMNRRRTHLLVRIIIECGGLCGEGAVQHYEKTAAGWVRRPDVTMWIS